MFLPYRTQFLFHVNIPQFLNDLRLPENNPRSIHPALRNAIHLLACSVSGLCPYEEFFLERTRMQLQESLATADRLEHFTWGSMFVAFYFRRKGRQVELYSELDASSLRNYD